MQTNIRSTCIKQITKASAKRVKALTAGHYCDRIKVTAAGCFVWAIMTTFFGCARTLNQGIAAWAINGLGLAMVRMLLLPERLT
jgi:hypothetical protein